jgi:nucleotide-binding universal stress UspA family protein
LSANSPTLSEETAVATSDIVVGIDGSPSSQAALRWAAHLARTTRWRLRAVHVLEWPIGLDSAGSRTGPEEVLHLVDSEVNPAYRSGMARVFHEVEPEAHWQLHYAEGNLAEVLVRLADDAQLLVIGSRERAVSGHLMTGGLSHYCISHSSSPVVIVPVKTPSSGSREDNPRDQGRRQDMTEG